MRARVEKLDVFGWNKSVIPRQELKNINMDIYRVVNNKTTSLSVEHWLSIKTKI